MDVTADVPEEEEAKRVRVEKNALLIMLGHVKRRAKRDRELAVAKERELESAVSALSSDLAFAEKLLRDQKAPASGQPSPRGAHADKQPTPRRQAQPVREMRADEMIPEPLVPNVNGNAPAEQKAKRLVLVKHSRETFARAIHVDHADSLRQENGRQLAALESARAALEAEERRHRAAVESAGASRAEAAALGAQLAEAKRQLFLLSRQQASAMEKLRRELSSARQEAAISAQRGADGELDALSGAPPLAGPGSAEETEALARQAAAHAAELAAQRRGLQAAEEEAARASRLADEQAAALCAESARRLAAEEGKLAAERRAARTQLEASRLQERVSEREGEARRLALRAAEAEARLSAEQAGHELALRRAARERDEALARRAAEEQARLGAEQVGHELALRRAARELDEARASARAAQADAESARLAALAARASPARRAPGASPSAAAPPPVPARSAEAQRTHALLRSEPAAADGQLQPEAGRGTPQAPRSSPLSPAGGAAGSPEGAAIAQRPASPTLSVAASCGATTASSAFLAHSLSPRGAPQLASPPRAEWRPERALGAAHGAAAGVSCEGAGGKLEASRFATLTFGEQARASPTAERRSPAGSRARALPPLEAPPDAAQPAQPQKQASSSERGQLTAAPSRRGGQMGILARLSSYLTSRRNKQ